MSGVPKGGRKQACRVRRFIPRVSASGPAQCERRGRTLTLHWLLSCFSRRDVKLPVKIISNGQTKDVQCRRGGQLSVIEEERHSCLEGCVKLIDGGTELLRH